MSGTMSRDKGKRGERQVIDALQPVVEQVYASFNLDSPILQRNTIQSDRGGFDIVGLEWFAPEVKNCEQFSLTNWWEQCVQQAKGRTPVLFYKKNNVPFRVRMNGVAYQAGTPGWVPCVVDISFEDFKAYFAERITQELNKQNEKQPKA